jgi:hypothetical protein
LNELSIFNERGHKVYGRSNFLPSIIWEHQRNESRAEDIISPDKARLVYAACLTCFAPWRELTLFL